jgi:hypothetical protein
VLEVVAIKVVVVAGSDVVVVVSTSVVVVVVDAASPPQAPMMGMKIVRVAKANRDFTSFLSLNATNVNLSPVGSDQVPVKSGFLFSTNAVTASVRSFEIR